MKKYWGKSEWSETLYLADVYENVAFDDDGEIDESKLKIRQRFFHGMSFDWKHILGFQDRNRFEDMNDFITYSEEFNIYQLGKI